MMQSHHLSEEIKLQIQKVISDHNVMHLFLEQLNQISGLYQIVVAYQRIYLTISIHDLNHKNISKESSLHKNRPNEQTKYVIRVGKGFPVDSVRLYIREGNFQPRLSDTRDLIEAVLGQKYSIKIRLKDIVNRLAEFDNQIHEINEDYLKMQKVGQYNLGDCFYQAEIEEIIGCSLALYVDTQQNKSIAIVGISETHLLTFTQIINKNERKKRVFHSQSVSQQNFMLTHHNKHHQSLGNSSRKLALIGYCELQSIQLVLYCQRSKEFRIRFNKITTIKNYHQIEKIEKTYKLKESQQFLRNILKFITKFQPTDIVFEPNKLSTPKMKDEEKNQFQRILQKVFECSYAQKMLLDGGESMEESKKREILETLNRLYQKLIEYYSARANPYYLIFVNKMNNLYLKYYIPKQ